MFDIKLLFGITAGFLSVIAFIPYIKSILRGETKPERSTWFLWAIVTILLFISFDEVGGGAAKWLFLGYIVGVSATALLSIKYGTGGWTRLDKVVIGMCVLTIGIWISTGVAFIALMMITATDILAAIPTFKHSWKNPEEESKPAWAIGLGANTLNLFAIEQWDLAHALPPIYLFLIVFVITTFVFFRPRVEETMAE